MSLFDKDPRFSRPLKKAMALRDSAASGDLVWAVSPSTVNLAPTVAVWTRTVIVTLQNAAGDVHDWFNKVITTGNSIADSSSAGTASIVSTTLTMVNGRAEVVVSGDAQAWLGGTAQVESITCTAGESTGAGNITMTITAAGMDNSPKAVVVAIGAEDDAVGEVGALLRTALTNDADVASFFVVSGATDTAILTAITPAANDGTMAFGFVDTDTTGVTFGASGNTAAGVAKETDTYTVAEATIYGNTVTAVTSVQTISD